jgi:uncharacterized iron-regulated protein
MLQRSAVFCKGSLWIVAAGLLSACGAGASPHADSPEGLADPDTDKQKTEAEGSDEPAPAEDVILKAARPFTGHRPADGLNLEDEALLTYLASADAICLGERHDNVLDHYAEWRLVSGLSERRPLRGFEMGVGLEMVRSDDQPTVDAYREGRVDDKAFEKLSNWHTEWGFPIQYYRPTMQVARDAHAGLLAMGVERSLTRLIAEQGLKSLSEDRARQVPELDTSSKKHRELFNSLMEGHPVEAGNLENYYEAQLVWDESMAESASTWLLARQPGRKLVILAGTAHCHREAIPARIERRTGLTVVSVLPVDKGAPLPIAKEPKTQEAHIVAGYDYQMVFGR